MGDVDVERLKVQLCMLYDVIKTALEGTIKKVSQNYSRCHAEVWHLPKHAFWSQQASFIILHLSYDYSRKVFLRVKTYLCSACRLYSLLLMHIHQDRTEKLDLATIAREFISVNSNYFGKRHWQKL